MHFIVFLQKNPVAEFDQQRLVRLCFLHLSAQHTVNVYMASLYYVQVAVCYSEFAAVIVTVLLVVLKVPS